MHSTISGSTDESGRNEINSRVSHNYQLNNSHSTMSSYDPRMRDDDDDDDNYGGENLETFNVTNRFHGPTEQPNSPTSEPPRTSDDAILHEATV